MGSPWRSPRTRSCPRSRADEYAALKADIAGRGVLVPIELDEAGNVLDGHHRQRAARELGLADVPTVVRSGLSEAQKREHALRLNLLRRHLGPVAWADAFRALAETRGLGERLGGSGGRPSGNADSVTALAVELGVSPRTARRRLRLADQLTAHPDLAAAVDRGDLAASRARQTARLRDGRAQLLEPPGAALAPSCDLRLGDFRTVLEDLADGLRRFRLHRSALRPRRGAALRRPGPLRRPGAATRWPPDRLHRARPPAGRARRARGAPRLPVDLRHRLRGGQAALPWRHLRVGWKPLVLFARPPASAGPWCSDTVASDAAVGREGAASLAAVARPRALLHPPAHRAGRARVRPLRRIGHHGRGRSRARAVGSWARSSTPRPTPSPAGASPPRRQTAPDPEDYADALAAVEDEPDALNARAAAPSPRRRRRPPTRSSPPWWTCSARPNRRPAHGPAGEVGCPDHDGCRPPSTRSLDCGPPGGSASRPSARSTATAPTPSASSRTAPSRATASSIPASPGRWPTRGARVAGTRQFADMLASAGHDYDVLLVGLRLALRAGPAHRGQRAPRSARRGRRGPLRRRAAPQHRRGGWETWAREAVEAEAYSRRLGRRIAEGYAAKRRRHADPGGRAPFGFRRVGESALLGAGSRPA